MRLILQTLTLLYALSPGTHSHGREEESEISRGPELSSDLPLVYDDLTQTVKAEKRATLRSRDFFLQAELILWDRNQSLVQASGEVILTTPGLRILCQSLELDLLRGDYLAEEVLVGFHPWSLEAESLSKSDRRIMTSQSRLLRESTSSPGQGLGISFDEVSFDQNTSLLRTSSGRIKLNDFPAIPTPPLQIRTGDQGKTWKIRAKAGKAANLGWYVGAGTKWEVEKIEMETEVTGFFKRGGLLGSQFSYRSGEESHDTPWVSAFLDLGWIKDQAENPGLDKRGLAFSDQRKFLDSDFILAKERSWRMAGRIQFESDSEINRDLRLENFSNGQWNDHFIEIGYENHWGGISGLQRWQLNEHEALLERRPNLRIETVPHSVIYSLYHSLLVEYSELEGRDAMGEGTGASSKLDLAVQSFHPFHLSSGLTYTPSFTFRDQLYQTNEIEPHRAWTEWSHELRFHAYGDYQISNPLWDLDGIRHSMDFIIGYRDLRLQRQKESSSIPKLDASDFRLNLEPISLIDVIEADNLIPNEKVRLEWNHQFDTSGRNGIRELGHLKIAKDLWSQSADSAKGARAFNTQLLLSPADWLHLRSQTKSHDDRANEVRVYSALLKDGYENQYQISRIEFPNDFDQWALSSSKLIDFGIKLLLSLRYDEERKIFPLWRAVLEVDSENGIKYIASLSERRGTSKEDEIAFSIGVRLLAF